MSRKINSVMYVRGFLAPLQRQDTDISAARQLGSPENPALVVDSRGRVASAVGAASLADLVAAAIVNQKQVEVGLLDSKRRGVVYHKLLNVSGFMHSRGNASMFLREVGVARQRKQPYQLPAIPLPPGVTNVYATYLLTTQGPWVDADNELFPITDARSITGAIGLLTELIGHKGRILGNMTTREWEGYDFREHGFRLEAERAPGTAWHKAIVYAAGVRFVPPADVQIIKSLDG